MIAHQKTQANKGGPNIKWPVIAAALSLLAACGGDSRTTTSSTTTSTSNGPATSSTSGGPATTSATSNTSIVIASTTRATTNTATTGSSIDIDLGVCAGGYSPALFAVDTTSGSLLWTYCPDVAASYEVLFATDSMVYAKAFSGSPADRRYELVAVEASSGKQRWRQTVADQQWAPGSFTGAGIVVVVAGKIAGTAAASIIGVDADTGAERWRVPSNGLAPIAHTDDTVVVGPAMGAPGGVGGLDRRTGARRWMNGLRLEDHSGVGVGRAPTAASGNTVVVPAGAEAVALDAAAGNELWRAPQLDHPSSTNDVVVGKARGNVTALDARTGAQLWSAPGRPSYGDIWVLGDGAAYVSGERGGIVAYDLRTGAQRWNLPALLGAEPWASANGVLYAGWERIVTALSTSDGQPRWTVEVKLVERAWMTALTTNSRSAFVSVDDFAPTD